jgi:hypothetical protein
MATLLVFEFPSDGPFGADAVAAYQGLAEHISQEHGLIWKVWTESADRGVAGGVYLFDNAERLAGFGITQIDARSFDVNQGLSAITRGL